MQALQLVELEFQMAVRDQIIDDQRTVVGNLWKVLGELAPGERISEIATELGIEVDTAEGHAQVLRPLQVPWQTNGNKHLHPGNMYIACLEGAVPPCKQSSVI